MDLLNHLETYISAQKGVGFNAFVFGGIMLLASILLNLFGDSQLAIGMRNGAILIGTILFLMGIGLRLSQQRILNEKSELYRKDQVEFKKQEVERMTKVKENYPKGQLVMAILATLSLSGFLFIKSPSWQGVMLVLAVFFVGNIILEAFSYLSIKAYHQQLLK